MPSMNKSFLVFLPQDEASADPVAEEVVTLIAAGLDSLLRLSDIQFRETCADASLLACIDSYLQNCRRQHDAAVVTSEPSAARASLHRTIFLVLLRSAETSIKGQPSRLLSVPRLFDVAILYGGDNATLTARLISQAIRADVSLASELVQVAEAAAQNISDVCVVCASRAKSPDVMLPSVLQGLSDGALYLRDVCLTLAAFVSLSPAAAPSIVGTSGRNLAVLAPLYDELLPALESAAQLQKPFASEMSRTLGHLRLAVVQLAALLLQGACLSAQDPLQESPGFGSTAETMAATARGELLLTSLIALGVCVSRVVEL